MPIMTSEGPEARKDPRPWRLWADRFLGAFLRRLAIDLADLLTFWIRVQIV